MMMSDLRDKLIVEQQADIERLTALVAVRDQELYDSIEDTYKANKRIAKLKADLSEFQIAWTVRELAVESKDKRIAELEDVFTAAKALVSMDGLPSAVQFILLKEAIAAADKCNHEWGTRAGGFLEHCRKCGAIAGADKENDDE